MGNNHTPVKNLHQNIMETTKKEQKLLWYIREWDKITFLIAFQHIIYNNKVIFRFEEFMSPTLYVFSTFLTHTPFQLFRISIEIETYFRLTEVIYFWNCFFFLFWQVNFVFRHYDLLICVYGSFAEPTLQSSLSID